MEDRQDVTKRLSLAPEELCAVSEMGKQSYDTTDELEPLSGIIGQERALRAIQFGLGMRSFGYNLFVAGSPGTGKKTLIRSLVEEIAQTKPTPNDIFFVHNFEHPEHPRAIEVPPGTGAQFREYMEQLIETLNQEVPKAFKSEDYEARRNLIVQQFQSRRANLIDKVQTEARERGLAVKAVGAQIITIPVIEGRELSPEQYDALPPEVKKRVQENQVQLSETIQEVYRDIRSVQNEVQGQLKDLDRTVALIATGPYVDEIRNEFREFPRILEYLEEVQRDLIDNISDFLEVEEEAGSGESTASGVSGDENPLKRYQINVIVDNSRQKGAPVVTESNPTFRNLVGYAEREAHMGTLSTDFTLIRAGSILAANGGYLILDLFDLLSIPAAWDALKRALQDREISIQDVSDVYGLVGSLGLRPSPVKIDLKVIVLGSTELYNVLYAFDEDFQKLFKIRAEFDTVMKKREGHAEEYARFVKTLCQKENLRPFDRGAVAALLEHSSRTVSDKTRLTLRFSDVADLIRESDYWAGQAGRSCVTKEDLARAVDEKVFRSNLVEERIQQMIDEGSILISTSGAAVGQVNGLSVFQIGDYGFGKPTRITAQVSIGEKGVLNIEREANLSGSIHDKGVLILSGFLHGRYGQRHPLSLNASICFEQSYSGVDGDSASSTELYAVLSSLAEVPLKQSIAVTGSIDQKGRIQPIGGVNEKIEGFFQACKGAGLSGEQGVIVPRLNVRNLMLKPEVIQAVREGVFHIYAIESVDEGLEILTGLPAGRIDEDGTYPQGTIHYLVQKRLEEMAQVLQRRYRSG